METVMLSRKAKREDAAYKTVYFSPSHPVSSNAIVMRKRNIFEMKLVFRMRFITRESIRMYSNKYFIVW